MIDEQLLQDLLLTIIGDLRLGLRESAKVRSEIGALREALRLTIPEIDEHFQRCLENQADGLDQQIQLLTESIDRVQLLVRALLIVAPKGSSESS